MPPAGTAFRKRLRNVKRFEAEKLGSEIVSSSFEFLARNTESSFFRKRIPVSELQCWLHYVIDSIKTMSTKQRWIKTGNLGDLDTFTLNHCLPMACQVVPAALAFEGDFFQVLASFLKARKEHGLPSAEVCDSIVKTVVNAYREANTTFDNKWSSEKTFKKLEASGVLEEFLLCLTAPQPPSFEVHGTVPMMNELESSSVFLKKKFRKGAPCGDFVLKILRDGRAGMQPVQLKVFKRLKNISSLVMTMDENQLGLPKEIQ